MIRRSESENTPGQPSSMRSTISTDTRSLSAKRVRATGRPPDSKRYSSNDRRCSKGSSVGKTLTMPRATASTSTFWLPQVSVTPLTHLLRLFGLEACLLDCLLDLGLRYLRVLINNCGGPLVHVEIHVLDAFGLHQRFLDDNRAGSAIHRWDLHLGRSLFGHHNPTGQS